MTAGQRTQPALDPDPVVAAFSRTELERNSVPDGAAGADRARCLHLVQAAFADDLAPAGVRSSALGCSWTDVFYAHLRRPANRAALAGRGWLPLDAVPGPHARSRWAVVENGRVLGAVHLCGPDPLDPVDVVLTRCREQGEVRLRDVLELCQLRIDGAGFPTSSALLGAAADIEAGLGGRRLAPWATGQATRAPSAVKGPARAVKGRRPHVVAISGVDGSGKSTLHRRLVEELGRAGVDVSPVWVRPGMGLGALASLATLLKRLLRQDAGPGLRAVASPDGERPASRRGAVGWVWSMLVCVRFISGVWRQHRAAGGPIILYDRYLVDALATLDFAYEGVDLRLHRWLVRGLLPRADVSIYLDVPVDVSVARKPDDLIGAAAIRRQLAAYDEWLDSYPPTVRLDATRPQADLVSEAVRWCLSLDRRAGSRRNGHGR